MKQGRGPNNSLNKRKPEQKKTISWTAMRPIKDSNSRRPAFQKRLEPQFCLVSFLINAEPRIIANVNLFTDFFFYSV